MPLKCLVIVKQNLLGSKQPQPRSQKNSEHMFAIQVIKHRKQIQPTSQSNSQDHPRVEFTGKRYNVFSNDYRRNRNIIIKYYGKKIDLEKIKSEIKN